jgi:uncharacterized membrane protein YphA (DoxX/SURF4 family)
MTLYSLFAIIGGAALVLTLIRYFIRRPSSILIAFVQNFVGLLFIFSGFIKANDPIGFGLKLEEYFKIFGMNFFIPYQDHISIIICVFEMAVGVMLLLGAWVRFTLWSLMLMMVFFTFLTFYAAYTGNIKDCGCFGDFMHILPWESFGKDILLLALTLILVAGRRHLQPVFGKRGENIALIVSVLACTWVPLHAYRHIPFFDFRAYKPGTNLIEAMKPVREGQYETVLMYKHLKTGEVKEFTLKNYPWQDTLNWAHDTTINKTIVEPILAPVHDFHLNTFEGSEYTEDVLNAPGPKFFLVCRDLSETNRSVMPAAIDFAELCKKENVPFYLLTSSSEAEAKKFEEEMKYDFEIFSVDGTQLKTMMRSNPGLVLIDGAVVKDMWAGRSLPSYTEVKEKYFNPSSSSR